MFKVRQKPEKISPMDGDYVLLSGMGGNINFPAALVHAALGLGGYDVEMVNDCGQEPSDYWFVDKEKYKAYLTGAEPWPERRSKKKFKVQVEVKHIPWGG